MPTKGVDETTVEGTKGSPDRRPPRGGRPGVDADADIALWWRSVGDDTAFVMEHTIDQLARKAGKDPVAYRRTLMRRPAPPAIWRC